MENKLKSYADPVSNVLAAQIDQLCFNSAKVLHNQGVESLHDLRVTALRISFALKFFRKFIDSPDISLLRGQLKDARKIMGRRRDLDIFFSRTIKYSSPAKRDIRGLIHERRVRAGRDLVYLLKSVSYKRMLTCLKQVPLTRNTKDINARNLLKEVFRKTKWEKDMSPEGLHTIRIRLKNLRYACEFMTDLYDKQKLQKRIQEIIDIQNILGEHQDAENAVRKLAGLKSKKPLWINKMIAKEKKHVSDSREEFKKIWRSRKSRKIFVDLP